MSAWQLVPRAVRRKAVQVALSDPRNVPRVRKELAALKAKRAETSRLLVAMDEAIQDTEALLGEVSA